MLFRAFIPAFSLQTQAIPAATHLRHGISSPAHNHSHSARLTLCVLQSRAAQHLQVPEEQGQSLQPPKGTGNEGCCLSVSSLWIFAVQRAWTPVPSFTLQYIDSNDEKTSHQLFQKGCCGPYRAVWACRPVCRRDAKSVQTLTLHFSSSNAYGSLF